MCRHADRGVAQHPQQQGARAQIPKEHSNSMTGINNSRLYMDGKAKGGVRPVTQDGQPSGAPAAAAAAAAVAAAAPSELCCCLYLISCTAAAAAASSTCARHELHTAGFTHHFRQGSGWAAAAMAIAAAAATAAAPLLLLRCCCRRRCCHCGMPHCHRHAVTTAAPTTHLGFTLQFFPWQMRRRVDVIQFHV